MCCIFDKQDKAKVRFQARQWIKIHFVSLDPTPRFFCSVWRQPDLFKDGGDGDGSRFESRNVTKLIIHGVETLRVPPGKLQFTVHAAGFTFKKN